MMSNNKILTVAYGTFSCTLEGFDDSFDTMKAIAEYFRDLAANDRYFGAEPPQPDAEMLARIAEREIARRVEAHLSEDGVHLRASGADVASSDAASESAEPGAGDEPVAAQHSETEEAAHVAARPAYPLVLQPSQSYTMVSMSATLPVATDIAQPASAGLAVTDVAAEADDDRPDDAASEDDAAQFFAQCAEEPHEASPLAEEVPARTTKPAPNSIADKLQRIRAVVSKSHEPLPVYSEDEHAEAILDEQEAESAMVAEFFSPHAEAGTEDAAADEDGPDAELAATLARLGDAFDAAKTADEPGRSDDAETAEADDEDQGDDADSDYDFSALYADEDAEAPEAQAVVVASIAPSVRARVIRVKRSDLQAALNAGLLVEDEAGADFAEDAGAQAVATEEDELDRLMSEADNQLDEAEGSSRRAAFDQMRGAVAASRADDGLESEEDGADEDAYRTDLAAAVMPRRPVAGGRTDRPRDQRPAPLKLVAEQRIDIPTARTGPVHPRRVATPLAAAGEGDNSFADYAAARGAHALPDLLEAAAAYLSFVEGRDHFSRPQLMTKVRQIESDGFSREEGLRQFGILLRSGKIEKVQGGRFKVSDDIGFRPDGERAAG